MKLYRFCSHLEARRLVQGEVITNTTDHFKNGLGGSKSTGFCLTADSPEDAWKYLKGIVTPGVCLEFEIPDDLLTKSNGKYVGKVEETSKGMHVTPLYRDEWCIAELRPEWLKKLIPLESFVPKDVLEAMRCFHRHKEEIVGQVKFSCI